ncbi:hypothetical protein QF034_007139 [Streptomyces africanus]|uniref:Uncharacterized protein n=1 Tax=Streptomyces africanus TaxID=231024 RepID=A0ABU0QZU6_9ACTN|nr:hypothetical protein [Streptomyces africanus]MDQ0752908.1 hypothetical protein [Streptomyces africanus]
MTGTRQPSEPMRARGSRGAGTDRRRPATARRRSLTCFFLDGLGLEARSVHVGGHPD